MSTRAASLALGENGACHAKFAWDQRDRPHQLVFDMLPGFFRDAGIRPADIGDYVVGIGPGSFSGTRVALAAANGLALPGHVPVHGLPSTAALAWDVLNSASTDMSEVGRGLPAVAGVPPSRQNVAIVGDARRNRCWVARYQLKAAHLETIAEPALHPLDALPALLPPDITVVSPDWERLKPILETIAEGRRVLREPRTPTATALLALTTQYELARKPLPPPQPIYLHPPV